MTDKDDEVIRATAELLEILQEELAVERNDLPSTRCMSLNSLRPIIKAAQMRLSAATFRRHSAIKIVQLLEDSGLLTRIPVIPHKSLKLPVLYAIGFNLPSLPSAFEVLQAFRPKGVLCYFSALELHGLTTQPAPHYHIAISRPSSGTAERIHQQDETLHSLGTAAFSYEGIDCYLTSRETRNLRGVQRRQLNSQSIVRVTSLEQTLLDCLHRPNSAGGPPVIFEAWEAGTSKIKIDRMWRLLNEIDDVRLFRRAGYMLEINAGNPALVKQIEAKADLKALQHPPDTLLPGIPYVNANNHWQLRTA